jgi:CHAT domain-containing protein
LRAHDSKAKPGWNFAGFGDALYVEADKSRDMNPGAERILAAWTDLPRGKQGETELKPLAGGRKEIIDIVKTVGEPAQTYFGSEATETLFKKVDLSRYAYIHLATHCATIGGYGADKKQPALVFSLYGDQENDGFLQMGEVFGLKLNADLVGVSGTAAASGQDTGESSGFYGLARAFLFAGADSVIMGALPTSQEHSARLFHDMYRNLRDGSKAEALRKAKLNMIAKQATSHPAYWASYILIGNSAVKHHPEVNAPIQADEPLKGMSVWKKLLNM